MAVVCDDDSQFEREALVETIRRETGSGSIAVTLTTLAVSAIPSSVTSSPVYVVYALLYACCAVLIVCGASVASSHIFRLTPPSRPNNVGRECPSVSRSIRMHEGRSKSFAT